MTQSKRVQGKRDLRQLLLLLHQYTGFIFAAYLIVVCTSGTALLLLENQISDYRDYLMLRVPSQQSKVSLAQMLRSVEEANPGKHVYHILESCDSGCTYDASMHDGADRLDALVDPYTARVLRTVVWEQTPIGILYNLHGNLFYGDTGAEINAIAGLSLVFMGITGLYLWPGWQAIRRGFTVKLRGGAYRINYDLHKVVGITAVSFLLMWSLTAAGQVLWSEPPEPLLSRPSGGAPLSLDKLAQIGDAALPGQLTMVYMPAHACSQKACTWRPRPVRVQLRCRRCSHRQSRTGLRCAHAAAAMARASDNVRYSHRSAGRHCFAARLRGVWTCAGFPVSHRILDVAL
jgi:uncharacterized iron-regulated membrane protein